MMKKRVFGLIMAGFMGAMVPMSAMAADQTITGDGSAEVEVSVTVNSSYGVRIPAAISMSEDADYPTGYSGTGTVGVKGNIPAGKAVYVVPTGGEKSGGVLTDASVTKASERMSSINSVLSSQEAGGNTNYYDTLSFVGSEGSSVTGTVHQDVVKFVSSHDTTFTSGFSAVKLSSNYDEYKESEINVSAILDNPDMYSATIVYTIKLGDKNM